MPKEIAIISSEFIEDSSDEKTDDSAEKTEESAWTKETASEPSDMSQRDREIGVVIPPERMARDGVIVIINKEQWQKTPKTHKFLFWEDQPKSESIEHYSTKEELDYRRVSDDPRKIRWVEKNFPVHDLFQTK